MRTSRSRFPRCPRCGLFQQSSRPTPSDLPIERNPSIPLLDTRTLSPALCSAAEQSPLWARPQGCHHEFDPPPDLQPRRGSANSAGAVPGPGIRRVTRPRIRAGHHAPHARHRTRHGRLRHAPPGGRRGHDGAGCQLGLFPHRHHLQLQLLDRARPHHRGGAGARDVAPEGDGRQRDSHLCGDHAEVGQAHLRALRDLHDPEPRDGPLRDHGGRRLQRQHRLFGPSRPSAGDGRGRGDGGRLQGHARPPDVAPRKREQLRAGVEFRRDRGSARGRGQRGAGTPHVLALRGCRAEHQGDGSHPPPRRRRPSGTPPTRASAASTRCSPSTRT